MADLRVGLDNALTLLHPAMADKITVVRDYGDIRPIYCAPSQLNQVFMHLLKRAVAAIKESGEIRITTSEQTGKVHVRISDTGEGIPPGQLEHIYDIGFGVTDSRVEMELGFAVDYSIVQEHQGEIEVVSDVAKGTEVTISLPIG